MGFNGEHAPIAGDPLEGVFPPSAKLIPEPRTSICTVLVARTSLACHAGASSGADVHRHPGDEPAFALDLAGVQPGRDLDADVARHLLEVSAGLGR